MIFLYFSPFRQKLFHFFLMRSLGEKVKRDRYQNADALNALIASLAMRNNSLDKGAAFIKFLNNHNQNAFLNDRQTDKKKRYAYTPLEIQLTTNKKAQDFNLNLK